eukprot:9461199-Alexandrium_andersonii.AAC.1
MYDAAVVAPCFRWSAVRRRTHTSRARGRAVASARVVVIARAMRRRGSWSTYALALDCSIAQKSARRTATRTTS